MGDDCFHDFIMQAAGFIRVQARSLAEELPDTLLNNGEKLLDNNIMSSIGENLMELRICLIMLGVVIIAV